MNETRHTDSQDLLEACKLIAECDLSEIVQYFNAHGDSAPNAVFFAQEKARAAIERATSGINKRRVRPIEWPCDCPICLEAVRVLDECKASREFNTDCCQYGRKTS